MLQAMLNKVVRSVFDLFLEYIMSSQSLIRCIGNGVSTEQLHAGNSSICCDKIK